MTKLGPVQTVGSQLWIPALIVGWVDHGITGAATAGLTTFGAISALSVFLADTGAGVEVGTRVGASQRFSGLLATVGVLMGGWLGGWKWGWLGAVVGYLGGIGLGLLAGYLTGAFKPESTGHPPSAV